MELNNQFEYEAYVTKKFELFIVQKGGKIMLTPTKNLHEDRTLIKVGAKIISLLTSPKSVNALWQSYVGSQEELSNTPKITFDIFILGLDFLFMIGAIHHEDDIIWRNA